MNPSSLGGIGTEAGVETFLALDKRRVFREDRDQVDPERDRCAR